MHHHHRYHGRHRRPHLIARRVGPAAIGIALLAEVTR